MRSSIHVSGAQVIEASACQSWKRRIPKERQQKKKGARNKQAKYFTLQREIPRGQEKGTGEAEVGIKETVAKGGAAQGDPTPTRGEYLNLGRAKGQGDVLWYFLQRSREMTKRNETAKDQRARGAF